jgi:SAM-dependent MidA family methyltransferase
VSLFDLSGGDENAALKDIIAERIRREGPVTFRDYMEMALYHPVHGYYFACDPTRDYQSSPNVHPLFGACLARQLAEMWRRLGRPARFDVVEAGAGNGRLAGDIARWLRDNDPDAFAALRYVLQDVTYSPATAARVLEALGLPSTKADAVADLGEVGSVEGCVLSNELLDAFPVHRMRVEDGRLCELRVGFEDGRFVDVPAEPSPDLVCHFEALGLLPGEGCEAEVNLEAPRWLAKAASVLRRGYLLTLDYGHDAPALYAPWRKRGTLLTFYRHTAGEDPYARVGRQDITASVDFTSLERAGEGAGLDLAGKTSQAHFLAALGIGEVLARRPEASQVEAYYALRRAAIELTDMAGLGRITVLAQAKGVAGGPLAGFSGAERHA